ncbi:MAG: hypothetical protein Q7K42_00850 [Candidatus Diapherotrites archaeon]|nr:hypothetical protein [Candidatus Diapherotrites archaeon]
MKSKLGEKAQASMEMLLLVAAGVLIAALVGLFLKSIPKGDIENKIGSGVENAAAGIVDIGN